MTYKGPAKKLLEKFGIDTWDFVRVQLKDITIEALILPGPETDRYIYLKLPNGYNIAYDVSKIVKIDKVKSIKPKYSLPKMKITILKNLPSISIIHCGGTIASRIEYSTGAVAPAFSPEELSNAVPEIFKLARVNLIELFNIFSENMEPKHWIEISKAIQKEFLNGAKGIIITHGTDTLHYSASALAFMLENLPGPVVFTGAMRSSDRPASDASINLIKSVIYAIKSDIGESTILMHEKPDDTSCLVHRGVRCIKLHSSRRDAFRSIGTTPLALIRDDVKILTDEYIKTKNLEEFCVHPYFENKTALVYIYPGIHSELIDYLVDRRYRGIVLVGTGLGHAPTEIHNSIQRAIDENIAIVMTTQCLWGGVFMNVYETGRTLLRMGVIPAHTILPHVAYVKLGWLLGQNYDISEIRNIMQRNLRMEIVEREPIDSFFYHNLSQT